MIAVNLIPESFLRLQRGRRRLRELHTIVLLSVAVICLAWLVVSAYVSIAYGPQEESGALARETQALRQQVDAQELVNVRHKQADEYKRVLDASRNLGVFSLRLAQCAVPERITLSAMHVRQDVIIWLGVSRSAQEISEMLSRIIECCSALQPRVMHMRKTDVADERYEDFEVQISFSRESDQFRSCYQEELA